VLSYLQDTPPQLAGVTMALLAEPRWTLAAQALVEGCIDLQNDEDRVAC
jgi:hypothetical protein